MTETMTLWFVQRTAHAWVEGDFAMTTVTVKGPFFDTYKAQLWIDKQARLSYGTPPQYRIVSTSLPFEVVES